MATKGERTRELLVTRAIRRFAVDGYRGTSVAEVARDCGVTPAATYAYFPSKEALFLAAVDLDAAGLVEKALPGVLDGTFAGEWSTLVLSLLAALEEHPLAKRVLSGREPERTERLLGIPALADLRAGIAQQLREGQHEGGVRDDIDVMLIADGLQTVVMSILIAVLQTGVPADGERAAGVVALLDAALLPPRGR